MSGKGGVGNDSEGDEGGGRQMSGIFVAVLVTFQGSAANIVGDQVRHDAGFYLRSGF
jgi:hypothetical protein